ncbi:hypothetical protein D3C71_1983590 [compost metagenome]
MGVEGLALARVQRHHRTVHWGKDTRVAKLGFITAQAGLGLADLRLVHVDARLGDLELGVSALQVFGTGGAGGSQCTLALLLLLG